MDQLLRIAQEPGLRQEIYERLGEYCHQCRNRLNSLKLSLYLVMRMSSESGQSRWEPIERDYQELERRVDQIQTLCRPLKLSVVTLDLGLLIDDRLELWSRQMAQSGKMLEIIRPTGSAVTGFDVERLGQGLDAFVAWRAGESAGGSTAKLRWWVESGFVHLVWEEAGMSASSIVDQAKAIDATWSLPLLARIILAHQGEYRVRSEPGYRLEISWPTVPPSL